ncbi:calcium-binding protein [Pararhodobacter sp.]|uniref:calcium-binding protein n=1 Tax=Pararhodobacter sp. TaxID=2127056 RepID=UPI002AFE2AC0|nr:calcium-binding protein [Pararhodobacter sp.]
MWMLVGLVGVLVASSMSDVFMGNDVSDDADGAGPEDEAQSHDEFGQQLGDLLTDVDASTTTQEAEHTDSDASPDADENDAPSENDPPSQSPEPESETDEATDDRLPIHNAPDDADTANVDDWFHDDFLSSDIPLQTPSDYYITLDDDGDQTAGGDGNDTLVGGAGDDWMEGQDGNDELIGKHGNDTLIGGRGADTLTGGVGDDSLVSGSGDGLLIGGSGNDALIGGEDNDSLYGGADDDTLQGGYGDDVLVTGTGADVAFGGAGNDTIHGFTPDASGRDVDGADVLNGGEGDDVLILGSGDTASGGEGADTFVLGSWIDPDEPALISDFDPQTDVLSVAYDETGQLPEISTAYDPELGGLNVYLDGQVVAFLTGVELLDVSSVTLTAISGNANG